MEFEDEFFSSSFIIANEQRIAVWQAQLVEAAASMFAVQRVSADDSMPLLPATLAMTVAAKSFVYEASGLRRLVVDIARRYPQFAADAANGLRVFDATFPGLQELRDSQAHLDERLNRRARNRAIKLVPDQTLDPYSFGLLHPPQVVADSILGTIASGKQASIRIDTISVLAAEQLVRELFRSALDTNNR
jgi:hypothetical protein